MGYRRHGPPQPLLFGYDPVRDLPPTHLARLVEQIVEATVRPPQRDKQAGPRRPGSGPVRCWRRIRWTKWCATTPASRH